MPPASRSPGPASRIRCQSVASPSPAAPRLLVVASPSCNASFTERELRERPLGAGGLAGGHPRLETVLEPPEDPVGGDDRRDLLTLRGRLPAEGDRALHETVHGAPERGEPLEPERGHRDLPPSADGSQHPTWLHDRPIEEHLVEGGSTRHLAEWADGDAGLLQVDDERREPLVLRRFGVAASKDVAPRGVTGLGGPHLLSMQDPAVAISGRPCRERREVRPGVRLREELAPDFVAPKDPGDRRALLVISDGEQGRCDHLLGHAEQPPRYGERALLLGPSQRMPERDGLAHRRQLGR